MHILGVLKELSQRGDQLEYSIFADTFFLLFFFFKGLKFIAIMLQMSHG